MKKKDTDLDKEIVSITKKAISVGYRHLDGAECTTLCFLRLLQS